jgi:preprotein translocase subunit SecA
MFTALVNSIWEEFGRYIFNVEVEIEGENGQAQQQEIFQPASSSTSTGPLQYQGGRPEDQPSALQAAAAGAAPLAAADAAAMGADGAPEEVAAAASVETRRLGEHEQIGRNDPCWCGSGKKFKKCHGA